MSVCVDCDLFRSQLSVLLVTQSGNAPISLFSRADHATDVTDALFRDLAMRKIGFRGHKMSKSVRLQKHVHPCSHKLATSTSETRRKTRLSDVACGAGATKKATATATATAAATSVDCGRSGRSGRSRGDASSRAAVRTPGPGGSGGSDGALVEL